MNGIAVAVKMLTMLSLNKILAMYVGPAGYAAIGQLQNFVTMITTFASGAINTGVIKYTAEHDQNEERQLRVWHTAGFISLVGSLSASIAIAFFSKPLAILFLKSEHYTGVFLWFSATLTLFVLNSLLLAILNGKKEIAIFVVANITSSLFALFITSILVIYHGLYGALVSLVTYQSFVFFITLTLCYRTKWFKTIRFPVYFDINVAKNLAKYALMALTTAVCVPLSHILVRSHIGATLSWIEAGYWDAMWRLSSNYLMLATTTLSFYYLPRLSELKNSTDLKNEIFYGHRLIFPLAAICGLLLYAYRDICIEILFTKEFLPMRNLFAWQLVGDTLKLGSWIFGYLMLGKAMIRMYIFSEFCFSILFVLLAFLLINLVGIEGVALAHAVNYFLYWVTMGLIIIMNLNQGKLNA